jgi:xylulokinase
MYLGLDLGTTNVKALVVDAEGRTVSEETLPIQRYCLPDGGVEQDLEEIWKAVCDALCQAAAGAEAGSIRALGVASQGGAMQVLDADEKPLGRVISWLDCRGQPFDEQVTADWGETFLAQHLGRMKSGLSIGQILRLRQADPRILRPPQRLAFVGDIIVGRLCGRRAHDATSLSIAMLYNPWRKCADPEVLRRLELEESQLPPLVDPRTAAGQLRESVARETGLRAGIPVSPAIHDQYAAALGAGAVEDGDVNFGSGTAWVLLAAASRQDPVVIPEAFLCTHLLPGCYGQMLSLHNGGSAIDWVLRLLGCAHRRTAEVDALLDTVPPLSAGLCFWPLLVSGSADLVELPGEGRIAGLTLRHEPAHLVRAVVEGLACELARHLRSLQRAGFPLRRLFLCGPAAESRHTPQIVANVTDLPVLCIHLPGVSAFGAAVLARALVEPGLPLDVLARQSSPARFTVSPNQDARRYGKLLARYLQPFGS